MGKLQHLGIVLDNQNAVYFAGQFITGHVDMSLKEAVEARGVTIRFKGIAAVRWSESQGTGKNRRTVTRHAEELYFEQYLLLAGDGINKFTIGAGGYRYPFSFQLPLGIPSSFQGVYGKVFYHCRACVDIPWGFDFKCVRPFTVNAVCDLNTVAQVQNPVSARNQKTMGCLCFTSGPISAVVTIDRMGYVPGENIYINAEITNMSSNAIGQTRAILHVATTYIAHGRTRSSTKNLSEVFKGPISPGGTDIWNAVPLPIPALPPTDLGGCNIIRVEYSVKFLVVPGGMSFDLKLKLPVFLGTIPLRSTFSYYGTPPHQQYDAQSSLLQPSAPPLPGYPDLPPPSYMEAMYSEPGECKDEESHEPFKPTYAYYNMKTQ